MSGGQLIPLTTPAGKHGFFWEAWDKGGETEERSTVPWQCCPWMTPEFIEPRFPVRGDDAGAEEALNDGANLDIEKHERNMQRMVNRMLGEEDRGGP